MQSFWIVEQTMIDRDGNPVVFKTVLPPEVRVRRAMISSDDRVAVESSYAPGTPDSLVLVLNREWVLRHFPELADQLNLPRPRPVACHLV